MKNTIKEINNANPQTFDEFFPLYLEAHSSKVNRWLHFIGTTLALAIAAAALITSNYYLLLLAPLVGYGFAWIGHFFVESNIPASYGKPLWSFRGDFKMYRLMLMGQLWN